LCWSITPNLKGRQAQNRGRARPGKPISEDLQYSESCDLSVRDLSVAWISLERVTCSTEIGIKIEPQRAATVRQSRTASAGRLCRRLSAPRSSAPLSRRPAPRHARG